MSAGAPPPVEPILMLPYPPGLPFRPPPAAHTDTGSPATPRRETGGPARPPTAGFARYPHPNPHPDPDRGPAP